MTTFNVKDTLGVASSLRLHWPEYLMEAGEISPRAFCSSACAPFTQSENEGRLTPGFPQLRCHLARSA